MSPERIIYMILIIVLVIAVFWFLAQLLTTAS